MAKRVRNYRDDEPAIRREKITKVLPVKLTKDELLVTGKKLADEQREMDQIEDAKKQATAEFKARIEARHAEIGVLTNMITTGEEHRSVECDVVTDYDERTEITTRRDTGEVVRERRLTDAEQIPMDVGAGI